MTARIHRSALVSAEARLGQGVTIGPYCVVEADTALGDGTVLHSRVVVRRFTTLGEWNEVHEGAVLGGEPQDVSFKGEPSYVVFGDGNRIRENVTVHRSAAANGTTVVGSNCFLMANAHVAHDNVIGDGVVLANNVALAGHVHVGGRAFLGGGAAVHQFTRVGRMAMVGGLSKVVQDCLPFVITDGNPARARGLNVVGLRRGGVGAESVRALKEAYRLLLRSSLPLHEAREAISRLSDPLVMELVGFVGGSKRGFHRE